MKVHPTLRTFDADPSLKSWWGVVANQLRGKGAAELPSGRLGSEVGSPYPGVGGFTLYRRRQCALTPPDDGHADQDRRAQRRRIFEYRRPSLDRKLHRARLRSHAL